MKAPQSPWRRAVRPLLVVAVLGALFVAVRSLRIQLGLEWSAESIQDTVRRLGYWAPLAFIALVILRQFLALPSVIVLTSAGLLFGGGYGMLLGALGITLNAFALFMTARLFGGEWVLSRLHAKFPDFEERARTAGPLVIAFTTAHPMGVLTPFYLAAGVTTIPWAVFLLAVGPASLVRAACYAFVGAYLLEPDSPQFWLATGVLVAVALLPLAHPGIRARLLKRPSLSRDSS